MDKRQELLRLKSLIRDLGEDSYLGPWLQRSYPSIERDLLDDFSPKFDYDEEKATYLELQKRNADLRSQIARNELELARVTDLLRTGKMSAINSLSPVVDSIERMEFSLRDALMKLRSTGNSDL